MADRYDADHEQAAGERRYRDSVLAEPRRQWWEDAPDLEDEIAIRYGLLPEDVFFDGKEG